jgi:hypothetical protein
MTANPSPIQEYAATNAGAREQILPDAVYTTNEAAVLVRVQPSTIRHAVRTGTIRGQGRPFRIRGVELFKLV